MADIFLFSQKKTRENVNPCQQLRNKRKSFLTLMLESHNSFFLNAIAANRKLSIITERPNALKIVGLKL